VSRVDDIRARAKRYQERAEAMRGEHGSIDAIFVIADRDVEVGGGLMAGALAYRIFIWLLPFALVAVGGIGLVPDVSGESPATAARSLGLTGIVASSVTEATRGTARWYALLIGIPILLWASRSLLKALVVVHRLVWGDTRRAVPKPTGGATAWLLGLLVAYFVIRELVRWIGVWTGSFALRNLTGVVAVSFWWLLVSVRLPHRAAEWYELIPGAVIVALGLELIADVGTYLIVPRVESSQSTYGALGIAATLLFGLYLVSRLVVGSAAVNATVWERRLEGHRVADT
jgi:uncharacterized BrkB/YihY/UPF0761 family membrane protein